MKSIVSKKLPDTPGVYFFLGRKKEILYIGRATSLRTRVRSYFSSDLAEKRSDWIAKMLAKARSLEVRKTDSVLEAMLLEADLIKKFQPFFNTDEKDDKSFNCVVITKEAFPRVLIVRRRELDSPATPNSKFVIRASYGPFPHGFELQTAMKIIRKIFPYRDAKCAPNRRGGNEVARPLPCFGRQIGLCPGVCTEEISRADYAKTIRNIRLFLEGKKTRLLALLRKEMKSAAKAQQFERAHELKKTVFALQHIQDVALLKTANYSLPATHFRIEAYDLSHFGGKDIVGAMSVVENGAARPSEYRLFKLRGIQSQHEVQGVSEVLERRFKHPEWAFPDLVVVDGNKVQKGAAEKLLATLGKHIPVVAVVKDDRHRPAGLRGMSTELAPHKGAILLANSEAHRFVLKFQKSRRTLR